MASFGVNVRIVVAFGRLWQAVWLAGGLASFGGLGFSFGEAGWLASWLALFGGSRRSLSIVAGGQAGWRRTVVFA
jgi:hypothetical protein